MIVEDDPRRRIGFQHDMIMLAFAGAVGGGVVDIIAQPLLTSFGIDAHAPRHAQMDHQGLAAVEFGQDIFGAARELLHHAALEPFGKARREGKAQIFAPDMRLFDGAAFQRGHQSQAHSLDFG